MPATYHEYRPSQVDQGSALNVSLYGSDKLSFVQLNDVNAPSVENAILSAPRPVNLNHADLVHVNGEIGVWANKDESLNWRGDVPLSLYPINEDSNPELVRKRTDQFLVYDQEVAIRYLRPPTPPPPGDIVLKELEPVPTLPAPPLVIRQQAPRPETPPPVVIREAPPPPPVALPPKIVTIPGKKLPPPPRKVVVERLPQLPQKPQSVIIERWLPYKEPKRRVVFARNTVPEPVIEKPKNVIIQWETPQVFVKKDYRDLGVVRANPQDYISRYGDSLKAPVELPAFVRDIRAPTGVVLAAEHQPASIPDLEGDIDALRLIDLDREGLGVYKHLVQPQLQRAPSQVEQPRQQQSPSRVQSQANLASQSRAPSKLDFLSSMTHFYDVPYLNAYLGDAFAPLDRNGNFKISYAEARLLLGNVNRNLGINASEADVRNFVDSFDRNRTGFIDFQEFKRGILRRFFVYEPIEQNQQLLQNLQRQ